MKTMLMLLSAASLLIVMVGCAAQPEGDLKPENQVDKVTPEPKAGGTPSVAPMTGGGDTKKADETTKPADDSGKTAEKPADETKVEPGATVPEKKDDADSKPTGT